MKPNLISPAPFSFTFTPEVRFNKTEDNQSISDTTTKVSHMV